MGDCAKRYNLCSGGKRGESIGERLKGVHWLILFLAWHKVAHANSLGRDSLLQSFFLYYMKFPFECFSVDVEAEQPFSQRAASRAHVWIVDPIRSDNNLGDRITPHSLDSLRHNLRRVVYELSTQ